MNLAIHPLTQGLNTSSSVSRCSNLAFGSRFCENGRAGPDRMKESTALSQSSVPKTSPGNFFEDFRLGQRIRHATPRTVTVGDVALYNGLFGPRFAVQSSELSRDKIGYPRAPVDDLLVFHVVFGKTVPDISLNAVANLGYADCRFLKPVYPGDTLNSVSEVIGLKENSNTQDRHRLCALARLQPERRGRARLCALGDGAQARRGGAGARGTWSPNCPAAWSRWRSAMAARSSMRRPTTPRSPAARTASAIITSANGSTMSTASRSRKPST